MRRFKNFWFYTGSFLIYLFLTAVFSLIAAAFLAKPVYGFLIKNFATLNVGSSNNIILVIQDDISVEKYPGDWGLKEIPEILDFFHTYAKPLGIGVDFCFMSYKPEQEAYRSRLQLFTEIKNMTAGYSPSETPDNNNPLFEAFRKNQKLNVKIIGDDNYPGIFNGITNVSKFMASQKINYGSVYIKEDPITKQVYNYEYLVRIGNDFYPSLALKMYLVLNNTNDIILNNGFIIIPKTGLKIPIAYRESLLRTPLWFYAPPKDINYSHPSLPAYRLLDTYHALKNGITPQNHPELFDIQKNPRAFLNPELFKDKIIIFGTNVSGASADIFKTPIMERHPGADIQATAFDNLVFGDFLKKDGLLILFFDLFAFLFLTVFLFIIILRTKVLKGLLSIIGLNFLYFAAVAILAVCGIITNPVFTVSAEVVTLIFGYSFKFITENRNKEKIKTAMGKYLSQDIMKNVVSNIDNLKLGGKRAVVTVLFSDIRGFTSISEKMPAEDVTKILNEYFTEMEPIITKYNGVINKFIGDAVMAIFGEPIQDINHPVNAVRCAYEMLLKVEYLREKWLREGKPKIEIGIGICTGEVFIGNIGSEARMEYTVIGDTVNLASRIEGYNKVYKTNLLVSSSTYSYISDIADVIKINEVKIRGKAQKMNIYEVLRIERPNKQ